jgi:hypothetical protein
MRACSFFVTLGRSLVITGVVCSITLLGDAQVRTSPSYQLESDSINFGGGLSSSTNYTLESTAGEIATGDSDSSTYQLRAGYQQMLETYLSLSAPADVIMTPNIGGLTGGTANGTTTVVVVTDSRAGYTLTFTASTSPAMQKAGDTIADYVPVASPNPDISFITGSADVHFGFSPSGTDVVTRYQNNGSFCNVSGSSTELMCWDGASTTPLTIAQGTSNHPTGATTTLHFRVGIGGTVGVPAGEYVATTTLTALPL